MAYAALSDVQGLIAKFTIDGSSKPTSTQVTTLIGQISADIDAVISAAGYAVPVASPAWFVTALLYLNALGAAALTLRSMFPDSRAAGDAGLSEYALYQRWYEAGLKRLGAPGGIPPDVATNSASVNPSTYFTRNPDTEEDLGDIAEPFFTRAKVF
jgi:hypothetical protein